MYKVNVVFNRLFNKAQKAIVQNNTNRTIHIYVQISAILEPHESMESEATYILQY